jgi:hypothetical protein
MLARCLLGAHVGRRAERYAGLRQRLGPAQRLGDPEVGHHGLALMQHHVFGLYVAVDDAPRMGIGERARHLAGKLHGLSDRQSARAGQPPSQRLALDEWHDVVEQAVGVARVDEGEDVRVVEAGGDLK